MKKPLDLQCKVIFNRPLTPTVFTLGFVTEPSFEFQAGQFLSAIIPGAGPNGRDLRRAYSIASTPGTKHVELCIKFVEKGAGTNFLKKLKEGDTFKSTAPFGDFIYKPKPNRKVCFIATGTGVSPFRSILASDFFKKNPPPATTMLFGVRTVDEILYAEEVGKNPNIKWIPCISAPDETWKGYRGRVSQYLKSNEAEFDLSQTDFYLCGSGDMIKEIKTFLQEKGLTKDQIHSEVYYQPKIKA